MRADDLSLDEIQELAERVVQQVADRRSTWRKWNLHAEAVRQSMPARFASTTDREAVIGMIVEAAESRSLALTPPEFAVSPTVFQRSDGVSMFRPKASTVYTSERVLAAEDALLDLSRRRSAPTTSLARIERAANPRTGSRSTLAADQAEAIAKVAGSGRVLDVLVGPAGAGKTTTMAALRRAWQAEYGRDSVIGLAPSAAAAGVLGTELGIATENTAKWLHEHRHGRWNLRKGQLVIVDEASLAGTFALEQIAVHAARSEAKVLLVGDQAQLQAVDAGGAFGLLVRDRDDTPELFDVRRFRNDWEKIASLQLRIGDTDVIDSYLAQGRVVGAGQEQLLDSAYQAWKADLEAGKSTVLIAETRDAVSELNDRARADRILAGHVVEGGIRLADGTHASRGDVVITRLNDRRLGLGRTWVKNNDRWIVTAARADGSLAIRREHSPWSTTITLPAAYAAEHVDLGYAITAHRAQGSTVDTGHAVVSSPEMTREALYVAMTRGREANTVYVVTDQSHLEEHQQRDDLQMTARSVLYGILQHSGAELSAHETITAEQDEWSSIRQLAAEYETIAQTAQHDRWLQLLSTGGLDEATIDELVTTDSYGILTTELRRLEAEGHDVDSLLPRVIRAGDLTDVEDLGSLPRYRMQAVASRYTPFPRRRQLIAGLIPKAAGAMAADMRQALTEREDLILARARPLARQAIDRPEPWAARPGPGPPDPRAAARRLELLTVIVAYRDRNAITTLADPLGAIPDNDAQRIDYERARTALNELAQGTSPEDAEPTRAAPGRDTPRRDR